MLKYTAARFLVFILFLSVFYLLGLRELALVAVALIISGVVSLFVLDETRAEAAEKLFKKFKKTD